MTLPQGSRRIVGNRCLLSAVTAGAFTWLALGRTARWENAEGYAQLPVTYIAVVLATAGVLGAVFPRRAVAIAGGMAGASAVLAIVTTSRGDGDGLWMVVFLWIIFTAVLLWATALLTGTLRLLITRRTR